MREKEASVAIWSCFPYVARGRVVGDASLEISLALVVGSSGVAKCKLSSKVRGGFMVATRKIIPDRHAR